MASGSTYNDMQVLPDTMRGTVLGFAARAPCNEGAIDITFGNIGYAFTLARVFRWVRLVIYTDLVIP